MLVGSFALWSPTCMGYCSYQEAVENQPNTSTRPSPFKITGQIPINIYSAQRIKRDDNLVLHQLHSSSMRRHGFIPMIKEPHGADAFTCRATGYLLFRKGFQVLPNPES
ncbi:hypothetical protein EVAR_96221_1 [Eumeta japonica]|uniref:Uncharacterized protein n=1 Tax=Eumeta variegata TaxID=151549 RepID=A0A4C1WND1_EUMVA|nr:hypothetical protein EVAR_96221_1 [Eumeta japonica]